mgnify:CR=1 FL=1
MRLKEGLTMTKEEMIVVSSGLRILSKVFDGFAANLDNLRILADNPPLEVITPAPCQPGTPGSGSGFSEPAKEAGGVSTIPTEQVSQAGPGASVLADLVPNAGPGATVPAASEPAKEASTEPQYTYVAVRAAMAQKSADGHRAQVRQILESFGVKKLSEIDESRYPDLMKELEAVGK